MKLSFATQTLRVALPPKLPLERQMGIYLVVNMLDVLATYILLVHHQVPFTESNPLARFFLLSFGFTGMIIFKLLSMGVVISICQFIALTKVHVARRVLTLANLIVCGVVYYSIYLGTYGTEL